MILGNLTKAIRSQNWFAVGIEFVIVVAGVFIGIQVSNWNEERQERRDEAGTLAALHSEIARGERRAAWTLEFRAQYHADLLAATDVIFGRTEDRPLGEAECEALVGTRSLYVTAVDLPALGQLEQTGRLDIISDPDLRRALGALIQGQESLRRAMALEAQQHNLADKYPEVFTVASIEEEIAGREETERSSRVSCDREAIRANPRLLNNLAENTDTFDAFMRDGLEPWRGHFREVHRLLDASLGLNHAEEGAP